MRIGRAWAAAVLAQADGHGECGGGSGGLVSYQGRSYELDAASSGATGQQKVKQELGQVSGCIPRSRQPVLAPH